MAYRFNYTGVEIDSGISLANSSLQPSDIQDSSGQSSVLPISQRFFTSQANTLTNSLNDIDNGNTTIAMAHNSDSANSATYLTNGVYVNNFTNASQTAFGPYIVPKKKFLYSLTNISTTAVTMPNIQNGHIYEVQLSDGASYQFVASDRLVLSDFEIRRSGISLFGWIRIFHSIDYSEIDVVFLNSTESAWTLGEMKVYEIFE